MALDGFFLDGEDTALLIVDIQDRLAAVMEMRERVIKNCLLLIELSKMLKIPVVVTEQYPRGLGHTVAGLQAALPSYSPVEKVAFNCCHEPAFISGMRKLGRKKVVVTGMEAHVCVLQTVLGLMREGFVPHLVSDAVCSRTRENRDTGVELMRSAGAVITSTETVLFQLLKVAGTGEFKAISKMIK